MASESKKYFQVSLPTGESQIWDAEKVDRNREWISQNNAKTSEVNSFRVTLPSGEYQDWDSKKYGLNIEWIKSHNASVKGSWVGAREESAPQEGKTAKSEGETVPVEPVNPVTPPQQTRAQEVQKPTPQPAAQPTPQEPPVNPEGSLVLRRETNAGYATVGLDDFRKKEQKQEDSPAPMDAETQKGNRIGVFEPLDFKPEDYSVAPKAAGAKKPEERTTMEDKIWSPRRTDAVYLHEGESDDDRLNLAINGKGYTKEQAVLAVGNFDKIRTDTDKYNKDIQAFENEQEEVRELVAKVNSGEITLSQQGLAKLNQRIAKLNKTAEDLNGRGNALNEARTNLDGDPVMSEYNLLTGRIEEMQKELASPGITPERALELRQSLGYMQIALQRNPIFIHASGQDYVSPEKEDLMMAQMDKEYSSGMIDVLDKKIKEAEGEEKESLKAEKKALKEKVKSLDRDIYTNPSFIRENSEALDYLKAKKGDLESKVRTEYGIDETTGRFGVTKERDPEADLYNVARTLVNDAIRIREKHSKYGSESLLRNIGQGLGQWATNPDTYSLGLASFADNVGTVRPILKKIEDKIEKLSDAENMSDDDLLASVGLTDGELAVLRAYFDKVEATADRQDISIGNQIGEGIGTTIELGLGFLMTGGVTAPVKAATKRLLNRTLIRALGPKGALKVAGSKLGRFGIYAMEKPVSDLAATVVGSAFMGSTYRTLGENLTATDDSGKLLETGKAVGRTALEVIPENFTEYSNGFLNSYLSNISKTKVFNNFIDGITKDGWTRTARAFLDNGHIKVLNDMMITNFGGEWEEELDGALIHYFLDDKNALRDFFSAEQQLVLIGTLAPIPALQGMKAGLTLGAAEATAAYKASKLSAQLEKIGFTKEEIARYMEALATQDVQNSVEQVGEGIKVKFNDYVAGTIEGAQTTHSEQDFREALALTADYLVARGQLQGLNLRKAKEDDEKTQQKISELEQTYGSQGVTFHKTGEDGQEYVETTQIFGPSGNPETVLVVSEIPENPDEEFGIVHADGTLGYVTKKDLYQGNVEGEDGSMAQATAPVQRQTLTSYAASLVMQDANRAEAERLAEDAVKVNDNIAQLITERIDSKDSPILYKGTPVTSDRIQGQDGNGLLIVDENGGVTSVPWAVLAEENGISTNVPTQEDKDAVDAAQAINIDNQKNQIAGEVRKELAAAKVTVPVNGTNWEIVDVVAQSVNPEDRTARIVLRHPNGGIVVSPNAVSLDMLQQLIAEQGVAEGVEDMEDMPEDIMDNTPAPAPETPAPEPEEKAIAVDGDGNKIYESVEPERALEDMYEDEDSFQAPEQISSFIDAQVTGYQDDVRRLEKSEPKTYKPKEKPASFNARHEAWQAEYDEAKKNLDFWSRVKELDAPAAAERARREERRKRQEELNKKYGGVDPSRLNPENAEEAVAEALSSLFGEGKMKISYADAVREGVAPEAPAMNFGRHSIITRGKGGMTVQDAANVIVGQYDTDDDGKIFGVDEDGIRDIIIDLLGRMSKSEMGGMILDNRQKELADAEREAEARAEAERIAAEKAEAERKAAQEAEAKRIAAEKAEAERKEAEEKRLAEERAEQERKAREEAERKAAEEAKRKKAEEERKAREEAARQPEEEAPAKPAEKPKSARELREERQRQRFEEEEKARIAAMAEKFKTVEEMEAELERLKKMEPALEGPSLMTARQNIYALEQAIKQREAAKPEEPAPKEEAKPAGPQKVNVESLFGALQKKGEAKLSDHVEKEETPAEKPASTGYGASNTVVSKERYEELKKRFKEKTLGQLNAGFDPELFAIGVQMAAYHIEAGARKFVDFCKRLIDDVGDVIRPYLKAIYNGARDLPGMESYKSEMDSAADVEKVDVQTFDKEKDGRSLEEMVEDKARENTVKKEGEKKIKKAKEKQKKASNIKKNYVTLKLEDGVTEITVDKSDYRSFLTPEAREFFAKKAVEDANKRGRSFASPELGFLKYASELGVIIPVDILESLPGVIEAEKRIADIGERAKDETGSDTLQLTDEEVKAYVERLLGEDNGSLDENGGFSGEVAREKKAFIVIGRPAGGKSSVFAEPLSRKNKARIIDSDIVKPWLKNFDGGYGANYVNGASARVADEAMLEAASRGENIVIPKIGGISSINEIALPLIAAGYKVELCFNDVSESASIMRAMARFADTGRYLSIKYLKSIGDKPLNTFRKFATKTIGEAINELSEEQVQELRRRIERLSGLEGGMAGAVRPSGQGILQGVSGEVAAGVQGILGDGGLGEYLSTDILVFSSASWKSNDVGRGEAPKEIWNSESGKPIPGTEEAPKAEAKPAEPVAEEPSLFDWLMEEEEPNNTNSDENNKEGTGQSVGEGTRDRSVGGGVSGVSGAVVPSGTGQRDGGHSVGDSGVVREVGERNGRRVSPERSSGGTASGNGVVGEVTAERSDGEGEGSTGLASGGYNGEQAADGNQELPKKDRKSRRVKKSEPRNTRNLRIPKDFSRPTTPAARLSANVAALEVLDKILKENRPATDEEKAVLSQFTGWGGINDILRYNLYNPGYSAPADIKKLVRLIDQLDPKGEFELRSSIRNAGLTSYYTPVSIASALNEFVAKAGITGGMMLDPSMGNGVFEGTVNEELAKNLIIHGIEKDWLTGQIAKALYPDARVMLMGYEEADTLPGSYDVVMSNIPFGDIAINDRKWRESPDDVRRQSVQRIHNYFTVKMMENTKPGGLCVILTSNAIMDTPGNQYVRNYLLENGEFIGAVRLPNNVFGETGTAVTTDVLVFRKYVDAADRSATESDAGYKVIRDAFAAQTEISVPAPGTDGKTRTVRINEYFTKRGDHMLGEAVAGGQYRADEFALKSDAPISETERGLSSILDTFAKRVQESNAKVGERRVEQEQRSDVSEEYKGKDFVSSGNLVIQDGKVGVISMKKADNGSVGRVFTPIDASDKIIERLPWYIPLRTTLKKLINAQIERAPSAEIAKLRSQLRKEYDKYVEKFGRLGDKANDFIYSDIDGFSVRGLEKWSEDPVTKKKTFSGLADIFEKNTISPKADESNIKDAQSAIVFSLSKFGYISPEFMEEKLGDNWDELCGNMIFKVPNTGEYVDRSAYLSGDVKTKLEIARAAAENDSAFKRNVEELEKVQPAEIAFQDIMASFGSRWIPGETYTAFVRYVVDANYWDRKTSVEYDPKTDSFSVSLSTDAKKSNSAKRWGTSRVPFSKILSCAFDNKSTTVTDELPDGTRVVNQKATEEANAKIEELRNEFDLWLARNTEQSELVTKTYNDTFNRFAMRKFDGSHLDIPGLQGMTPRAHQKDAVWRILQQEGGVIDHIVGAGKTLVMQMAAMELKRLGIAKKPMILATKATAGQIAKEFHEAFPAARILVPGDNDFSEQNRKKLLAKIAVNDYDCIILTHNQYAKLDHDPKIEIETLNEQIDMLSATLWSGKEEMSVSEQKRLEKQIEKLRSRLDALNSRDVDPEFTFEGLGVDFLFVDEMQVFKNLAFSSKANRIAGLGDKKGSQMSYALLQGIRYLQKMRGGDKGTVFLSGTTISNSLAELYHILNYLRPGELERLNMRTFDAWAETFAVKSKEMEYGVTTEIKEKERFRAFKNLPELARLYAEIADVRNDQNLKLPKPRAVRHEVIIPKNEVSEIINQQIIRMVHKKDGAFFHVASNEKTPWGLIASGLSSKAALNPKLIDKRFSDKGSKIYYCVDTVKKIFDEEKDKLGTQLIFIDNYSSKNGYDARTDLVDKLVESGIPRDQIARMDSIKTKEQRDALFAKVNSGTVRIVIGGSQDLGTGVNVQHRLKAIHHLDAPWNPASVEQRNGRGIRQGNMYEDVDIFYYALEGSLDLYKYQLLDIKKKMFDSFKMNTVADREMEEADAEGNGSLSPAEVVARLSGNDVILEKSKIDKKVERLRRAQRTYESDYAKRKKIYEDTQRHLYTQQRFRDDTARDIRMLENMGFVKDAEGKYPTTVTVNIKETGESATFDKPKEAGEYIQKALKMGHTVTLSGFGLMARIGFNQGSSGLFDNRPLEAIGLPSGIPRSVAISSDILSTGLALRRLREKIDSDMAYYEKQIARDTRDLETGAVEERAFPKQAELDQALEDQKRITEEYNQLAENSNKSDAEADRVYKEEMERREREGEEDYVEDIETGFNTSLDIDGTLVEESKQYRLGEESGFEQTEPEAIRSAVTEAAERLGVSRINIITDKSKLKGKDRRAKGWYDAKTDTITIVVPNNTSAADAVATIAHEIIGHKGLRGLFGDKFDAFLDDIYENADAAVRARIDALMDADNSLSRRDAVEEYMSQLAEDGLYDAADYSLWDRIKRLFRDLLRAIGLDSFEFTDADLRYILWQSRRKMQGSMGLTEMVDNTIMRRSLREAAEESREDSRRHYSRKHAYDALKEVVNFNNLIAKKGQPLDYAFTANDFYVFENPAYFSGEAYDNWEIKPIFRIPIEGNQEQINEIKDYLDGRTSISGENLGFNRIIEEARGGERYATTGRIDALQRYSGPEYNDSLYSGREADTAADSARSGQDQLSDSEGTEDGTISGRHYRLIDEALSEEDPERRRELLDEAKEDFSAFQLADDILAADAGFNARTEYERQVKGAFTRIGESLVNQYNSIRILQDALAKESGLDVRSFEDAETRFTQVSSRNFEQFQEYKRDYLDPLWDARVRTAEAAGVKAEDVDRYIGLKSGIERNIEFAKRDARETYESEYESRLKELEMQEAKDLALAEDDGERNTINMTYDILRQEAKNTLDGHIADIEAGTDSRYKKNRKKDYAAIMSWFIDTDAVVKQRAGESLEDFNRRMLNERNMKPGIVTLENAENEARKEIEEFENKANTEEDVTGNLWEKIRAATRRTVEYQYRNNMITKDQYERLLSQMEYYVPMRGFDDPTAEDIYSYRNNNPGTGGRFQPTIIHASGRSTRYENPLTMIGQMHQSAVVSANKNWAKLALYNLVSNRKGNSIAVVAEAWYEATGAVDASGRPEFEEVWPDIPDNATFEERESIIESFEAEMKEKAKKGLAYRKAGVLQHGGFIHIDPEHKDEHIVNVKMNGRDYQIIINSDPRAAQAANGLSAPPQIGKYEFGDLTRKITRILSVLCTSANPVFWISNHQRDLLMALVNTSLKEDGKYFADRSFNTARAYEMMPLFINPDGALAKKVRAKNPRLAELYDEFRENGGITGSTVIYNRGYFEKEMKKYERRKNAERVNVLKALVAVGERFEAFGEAIEQVVRFATFMTSREHGRDIQSSISDAKEVSMNFNRKGAANFISWDEASKLRKRYGGEYNWFEKSLIMMAGALSPIGRAAYMFFNPAIQGLRMIGQNFKNSPAGAAAWYVGIAALGFANAMLHMAGGDDDKYMSLPDWVRKNNLLIGNGKYFKWAMPQELRFAYGIGDSIAEAAAKRKTRGQIVKSMLDSVSEILPANIFGDGAGLIHALIPSPFVPLYEVVFNKNFYGGPIYKDTPWTKNLPGYEKVYGRTSPLYVNFAKTLNDATGGNKFKKGAVNINPAIAEHLVTGYLGGLGTTIWDLTETINGVFSEDADVIIKDVPGLNRLMLNSDDYMRDAYVEEMYQYFWWNHGKDAGDRMKKYEKERMHDEIRKERDDLDYKYYKIYQRYDKKIEEARKKGNNARVQRLKKQYIERCLEAYYGIQPQATAPDEPGSGED